MEPETFPGILTKSSNPSSIFKYSDHSRILKICFQPLHYPLKFSGLFPLRIAEDGSAHFKWLSIPTFVAMISACLFLTDSVIFIPFVYQVMTATNATFIVYAAEFAFSAGNYFAAVSLIFLVPYVGPRLSKFWNRISAILQFLGENGMGQKFQIVHRFAIFLTVIWAVYSLSFCLLNWWYFDQHLKHYFGDSATSFYVMSILGQTMFTVLIAMHTLHSMAFVIFCSVISQSFKALGKLTALSCTKGKREGLEHLIGVYEDLNSLVCFLGETYGIYIVVELITMLISTVTNAYFIFSGIRMSITTFCSVFVRLAWLFTICNAGEYLRLSGLKCRKSLKHAALLCQASGRLIATTLTEDPPYISACNYFSINRQLITKVIGTVTTYLVVLLQFHVKSASSDFK